MKKLPKGLRKHIRREKARIRREFLDKDVQGEKIEELINKKVRKNINNHFVKDKLKT